MELNCNFLIIDSLNRMEYGTGVGRQSNLPVLGYKPYEQRPANLKHLPSYLPDNYYLDVLKPIIAKSKPIGQQRYISYVITEAVLHSTYPTGDLRTVRVYGKGFGDPPQYVVDESGNKTLVGGSEIEVYVNDLMDDNDAPMDDPKQQVPVSLDNNRGFKQETNEKSIGVTFHSDNCIVFKMPASDVPDPIVDYPVRPGLWSIQIRVHAIIGDTTQTYSIFDPFAIQILAD